eukprot:5869585-Ditylum_brightwellii.AAC.1
MVCKESMANRTDYMGYIETNLKTMCGFVTKAIHENARKVFNQCKIVSASSSIPVENYYKPGGTMSMIQGNLTTMEWQVHHSYYRLPTMQSDKKQGVITYHQQVALLNQDGCDICPQRVFIPNLIKLLGSRKKMEN